MVDHIIGNRDLLAWSDTAKTLPKSNVDISMIDSDHVPQIVTIPTTTPQQPTKHITQHKWRLSNLDKPEIAQAYIEALQQALPKFNKLATSTLTNITEPNQTNKPTEEDVDSITDLLLQIINAAATQTIGKKTIKSGKTKP